MRQPQSDQKSLDKLLGEKRQNAEQKSAKTPNEKRPKRRTKTCQNAE
jgi:hypothetical protein